MSNSADPSQPGQQPQGGPVPPPYTPPGQQPPYPQSGEQAPSPSQGPQAPYPQQGQQPPYAGQGQQAPYPGPGAGQIPPGYPVPPPAGAPLRGNKKRGLMWALIIGGVVIALIAVAIIVSMLQQRAAEQAAADRADAITATVEDYLTALAESDAEAALSHLSSPESSPLLTDEVLAASNEAAPIGGVEVEEQELDVDDYSWDIRAHYTIGEEEVTADFSVSEAAKEGEFAISGGLGSLYVPSGYVGLGLTVNGVAVEAEDAAVFPGTYAVALSDERYELGGTSSLVVTAPFESAGFSDLEASLTDATIKELRAAVKKDVDACVSSKKLKAGCGLTLEKTMNSGDVTLTDGTVSRSLPSSTKSALKKLGFTVAYDDPLVVTSDYIGSVDVEADGKSKSGQSGRYEIYFGGPSLGSATIDLSGEKPEITWDD